MGTAGLSPVLSSTVEHQGPLQCVAYAACAFYLLLPYSPPHITGTCRVGTECGRLCEMPIGVLGRSPPNSKAQGGLLAMAKGAEFPVL